MKSLALIIIFSFGWMANAAINPNGVTGSGGKWLNAWTNYFNECFEKSGTHLAQASPPDKGEYCGSAGKPVDYWRAIFIPLAEKESNFDPNARGKNGGKVPIGLYQMDSQDMKSHKCEGSDPANPQQSICCAIKIADNQAQKYQKISQPGSNQGIMSGFWQPMKDGIGGDGAGHTTVNNTENHNYIKKASKEVCGGIYAKMESPGTGGAGYSNVASSASSGLGLFPMSAPVRIQFNNKVGAVR